MADTGKTSKDRGDEEKGDGELTTKKYDKQLAKLHAELVRYRAVMSTSASYPGYVQPRTAALLAGEGPAPAIDQSAG
jgi:hypothetical protein